jgi:hypothetical protein
MPCPTTAYSASSAAWRSAVIAGCTTTAADAFLLRQHHERQSGAFRTRCDRRDLAAQRSITTPTVESLISSSTAARPAGCLVVLQTSEPACEPIASLMPFNDRCP